MLNKNNRDNLSITEKPATVNLAPSTITHLTCPTCDGRRAAAINTGLLGKPLYAPCGGCGGSGSVEDGIAPAVEGGFDVYVEGIYFWESTQDRAAERYNDTVAGLAVRKRSLAGFFQGQERLRQWRAEYEEIEVAF